MQRLVRELLESLVVPLPIERQRLETRPALLLVEPAPRQEQSCRVNPVGDADVPHDPKANPVTPRRLEPALARAELAHPDVMRRPVLPVDVVPLLEHPGVVREALAAVLVVVDQAHLTRAEGLAEPDRHRVADPEVPVGVDGQRWVIGHPL